MELSEVLKSKGLTCAIPYAKVGEMLRMIDETVKDDKERAIGFCGDGNKLSFPRATGEVGAVKPPECPAGKEKIGDFHTHRLSEEGLNEKSMEDWVYDTSEDISVSCIGLPEIGVMEGQAILQRTISCLTFQRSHPKYNDFRGRLFLASMHAMACEDELATTMESRDLTVEECAKYREYKGQVTHLVQEGISEGIISPCVPKTTDGELHLPDVEAMLEAQKLT